MNYFYTRPCSDLFNFPKDSRRQNQFLRTLLGNSQYICICGVSGVGKTYLTQHYSRSSGTLSKWRRDVIFKMLWHEGQYDPKFNNYIKEFEAKAFQKIMESSTHQLIYETWGRTKTSRNSFFTKNQMDLFDSICIVLDGPVDKIFERNEGKKLPFLLEEERKEFLEVQQKNFLWPSFEEGWKKIYYINTFGKEGESYLKERLRKV